MTETSSTVDQAKARLLVVDDQSAFRRLLLRILAEAGYELFEAADAQTALEMAKKNAVDVVITDIRMPGQDGHGLLANLRRDLPQTQVILLTAYGSVPDAVEAMKHGACDYLTKPLANPEELRSAVQRALRHRRSLQEPQARGPDPELQLVWADPQMKQVYDSLVRLAPTSATVLLQGETGTGKEVVARTLHQLSPRKKEAFVAVNCAALSEGLLDSELFGHEKGAFTGADRQRQGRFELANGGTLLLDEVGEMSPLLQVKLLRVLQERNVVRVGGHATLAVDVRVIAATHRDLQAAVLAGNFREDLYYRLAVVPVRVPPLRERRGDILVLAEHFLQQLSRRYGRQHMVLDAEAKNALLAYVWPGNVRELYNVMERALVLTTGSVLGTQSLSMDGQLAVLQAETPVNLRDMERQAILRALEECGGNRRMAAQRLGIGLRTLQYKLNDYELR